MSTQRPTTDTILEDIRSRLEKLLENKPTQPIDVGTNLTRDLRLDSITSVELLAELEDHYSISIDLDDFAAFETVGDVVKAVDSRLPN